MNRWIAIESMTTAALAAFGDVMEVSGVPDKLTNHTMCGRYNDRAQKEYQSGDAGVSQSKAEPPNCR